MIWIDQADKIDFIIILNQIKSLIVEELNKEKNYKNIFSNMKNLESLKFVFFNQNELDFNMISLLDCKMSRLTKLTLESYADEEIDEIQTINEDFFK